MLLAEGERLLAARHLPEAIGGFLRAEAAGMDADRCAAGRWMTSMLLGEFEGAWQESDAIRRRAVADPNRLWQGESLVGKRVIVRCLHGYGDAVQMLRYAPRLCAVVSRLIVEAPPRLLELARCFEGVEEVITWGAQAPLQSPEWGVQIEIMELPYVFRTQPTELPLRTRYLHLPGSTAQELERSPNLRVGLAWTAGSWNPARAISFDLLRPLFEVEGCEFWSLQGGSESVGAAEPFLHEDARSRESIEGLAAAIAKVDLVITVDTLAAHLAGALDVSAWVMLQHEADWRWMHGREDSPWYPSLRLFRQGMAGDWAAVIASVRDALRARAKADQFRQVA